MPPWAHSVEPDSSRVFDTTVTCRPACASRRARVRPAAPLPRISTSEPIPDEPRLVDWRDYERGTREGWPVKAIGFRTIVPQHPCR